jgi:hypothetical protein
MTKVILYEVDRLACVEKMRGHRVSHAVHGPSIGREICQRGVAGEEGLYPALAQAPLATDEERRIVIGPGPEVALEKRYQYQLPNSGFSPE